jgi:hypothetical protein
VSRRIASSKIFTGVFPEEVMVNFVRNRSSYPSF